VYRLLLLAWKSDVQASSTKALAVNERHSWARSELYIRNLPGMRAPTHIARDHMTVTQNLFYYGNMSCPGGPLHSRLQVNDSSPYGRARYMPTELIGTRRPFPAIRLSPPGHKYAMYLEVALIGPPCTRPIRENIPGW